MTAVVENALRALQAFLPDHDPTPYPSLVSNLASSIRNFMLIEDYSEEVLLQFHSGALELIGKTQEMRSGDEEAVSRGNDSGVDSSRVWVRKFALNRAMKIGAQLKKCKNEVPILVPVGWHDHAIKAELSCMDDESPAMLRLKIYDLGKGADLHGSFNTTTNIFDTTMRMGKYDDEPYVASNHASHHFYALQFDNIPWEEVFYYTTATTTDSEPKQQPTARTEKTDREPALQFLCPGSTAEDTQLCPDYTTAEGLYPGAGAQSAQSPYIWTGVLPFYTNQN